MPDPILQPSDVLWACVEEGFHVGSREGDFLGYVDRQPDGSYIAYDARSVALGSFPSLPEATSAVAPPHADLSGEGREGVVQV